MRVRPRHVLGAIVAIACLAWVATGTALYGTGFLTGKTEEKPPLCYGSPIGGIVRGVSDAPKGATPPSGRFAPLVGEPGTAGLKNWPAQFDVPPKAFDINRDGVDELVAMSNDTHVYVFNAATGRAVAKLPTSYPPNWYIERILNAVEVAVLRPGEAPSIVVADHAACLAVWRFVPAKSDATTFAFEKVWERRLNDCFWNPGMDSKPSLADADKDGTLEIFAQTEEQGFFAVRADGEILWKQCWAGGNGAPALADLDSDGRLETIVASDSGFVAVLNAATGQPQWTFNAADPKYGIAPASISVTPTVADLDGQKPLELIFTARYAPRNNVDEFGRFHMAIFAIHQDLTTWQGTVVWVRQPEWANPLSYTRLIVRDVDHDGSPEIFGMDWNTIGHIPGHWERLGPAHVFRLNARGEDVWVRDLDAWWSNKDLALGDVDGDGTIELLANGPRDSDDGLWKISVEAGVFESFHSFAPWKMMRGPLLYDLRHDGTMQLVVPVTPVDDKDPRGAFLIHDLGVPFNAPWNGFP